ncbi:MAG: 4-hydroxybenzoate octaprenyltransferase [Alphaproteobacteria bacterium]|nr:4-hydroxybenzoate octaprenyltransferase [Alphaproteobacteria bacterium]
MTHTDIDRKGWISYLPGRVQPYALLMRLDRPIGTWLLLLPGWWAVVLAAGGFTKMNATDIGLFLLFGVGAVIMRGAGCIINDLWDRDFDCAVERTRTRPLASGVVSTQAALILLTVLLLLGLMILLQMGLVAIFLGILTLPLIITYPLMKRVTWWPQFFLGITFNAGALIGWAAVTGAVGLPALLIYAGGIFWTLGYDTIYAHQDKDDDALIGVKSTARRLGSASKKWVIGFYAAALFLIAWGYVLAGAGWSLLFFGLAAFQLAWQCRRWQSDDPASSLATFRSNRDFGLILLLAAGW